MTFEEAVARVAADARRPGGIGTLREKSLHATLKYWLDDDPTHHEIPLPSGQVADIYDGQRVTEIQTAGFSALRPKLVRLFIFISYCTFSCNSHLLSFFSSINVCS